MDPNPLELLREELTTDEVYVKVNAIHRLQIVATVLGPEQVKSQLLPYLATLTNEDDEVLFALAQELGALYTFLPGQASALMPLLETLAAMDETVVRDQAVKSLMIIADVLPDSDIINLFVPTVIKLSTAENFSARVSACALFASAYPRSGNLKEKLRQKFLELSHEETPMVRRAAVIEMGVFAKVIEKQFLISELIPDLRQLAQDEQDQVRTLCVDSLIEVSKLLNKEENKLHSLPIIILIGEDKSWKVRYTFAKEFPALSDALGKDITESSLIQTFVQVLRDIEADVKAIALLSLKKSLQVISRDRIQTLVFPTVEAIAQDVSLPPKVRKNCAQVISEMVGFVGKEFAAARISPICLTLLNDDNYEIKLKMIEGLGNVAGAVGPEFLSPPICEILLNLAKEAPQWRLRESVYKSCVSIAQALGEDVFIGLLQPIYFNFLTDTVNEVRKTGVRKVADLVQVLSQNWVLAEFLPKLEDLYHQDLGYISRRTVLHALSHLTLEADQFIPIFTEAAKDKVANIRLVLCKVIKRLSSRIDIAPFKTMLQELSRDPDKDVKYFAIQALK
ncbi:unnamed protein product [Blepharisma stoltei]|uniref:Uncharacterized protein n=1 Tax=Blepharisma stoltei TaxID=1481888 RepID=A0AAU9JKB2_9CILI|nr:unnamed protein product [Blepharisma stoltei]